MSLGQDIIFMASRGKCKPPKHIGLNQTLHQKTKSKDLVTLVHRFGHGVSYEDVQRINLCWSEIQLSGDEFIMQASISSKAIPPLGKPPGHDLKRANPRDNQCVQKLSPRDRTGSQKPNPLVIKLENFSDISINSDTI